MRSVLPFCRGTAKTLPTSLVLAFVLFVLTPLSGRAQQQQQALPQWLNVVIVRVKPNRVGEFEDIVKQFTMAARKANRPPVQIFQVVRGDQATFHIVSGQQALAQFDNPEPPPMPPGEAAALFARLTDVVDSTRQFVARVYPDSSIAGNGPSKLSLLISTRVVAQRGEDYVKWLQTDLTPALKKANVQGVVTSRGFVGDSAQNFYQTVAIANWAAFDQPNQLVTSMGQAAFDRMQDKLKGIVESSELTLFRPRPDLANPTE